jgi:hypothetical protein
MYNVKDSAFEVIVNGSRDESASIQRAIKTCADAGGGDVFFPVGVYSLKNAGSNAFCIKLANKVRLVGESRASSIIKQDLVAPGVKLINIESDDCGLSNLTLDGNAESQSIDQKNQRHGIFVVRANRLLVENVTSQNFTGDGFYIGTNVSQVTFSNVLATLNKRDGIALANNGNISDIKIINSTFINNAAQQIDSEPEKSNVPNLSPQVNNVTISGCIIDPGSSNDYAVTCSGDGEGEGGGREDKNRSHGWTITGNIIKGSVLVVWCDDVCITGNIIDNPTTKPCVDIQRTAKNIVVTGNRLRLSQTGTPGVTAVSIGGKKEETIFDVPSLVSIANNTIGVIDSRCLAVLAQGADSVSIIGNQIDGGAIQVRATAFGSEVFRSAVIIGNTIANIRPANPNLSCAIACMGDKQPSAAGRFSIVDISHNVIINMTTGNPRPSREYGIFFDNQSLNSDIQITASGNHIDGDNIPLTNFPSVPYLTGGNRRAGGIYSLKGNPQGIIENEIVGAIALNQDDGKFYVFQKTGTGNAWVEK